MPSALVGRSVPEFRLPDLITGEERTLAHVRGQVSLINVWATWCPSCLHEHPYLVKLAQEGVRIVGLNYKDEDAAALRWLQELGDPYALNLADREGTLGLDLGVYGAPETYLIDAAGVVHYRHVGVVDAQVWGQILQPLYAELQGQ